MNQPRRWFRDRMPERREDEARSSEGPLVVVVGPCAAGKSTLAAGLRQLGFRAMVSGQEHSDIPTLWRRADPDVVVALEVDLDTIRRRRDDEAWPEWLYALQRERLALAERAAAIQIDTTTSDADDVLARVAAFLGERERGRGGE